LIEGFCRNRTALQGHLELSSIGLELMSPPRFVTEVLNPPL
jgi:hypothetical protein